MTLNQLKREAREYYDHQQSGVCHTAVELVEMAYELGKKEAVETASNIIPSYPATIEQSLSSRGELFARIDPSIKLPEGFSNVWCVDRQATVKPGDKVMIRVRDIHDQYCTVDDGVKERITSEY